MKNKMLLLIPILLLTACELTPGGDAQRCNDDIADHPEEKYTYSGNNPKIRESYKYELNNPNYNHEREPESDRKQYFNNSNKEVIPEYAFMDQSLTNGIENMLLYASDTSLMSTANLPLSTRYQKIFDGQVSCVGEKSNSRIGIYSDGIIVDLNRTLQDAKGVTLYMTHNYLTLKMKAIFTLYKPTGTLAGDEYDEYSFSFYTNLGTSVAGPKFFYLDLTKVLENTTILKGCNMLGFRFERIDLTDEEKEDKENSKFYAKYYDNLQDEKNHTKSDAETFVKLYDIGLPYSTWSK